MNHTFTIFGSTGDLTYRKLLPALFNMSVLDELGDQFKIVAIGRKPYSREQYIETFRQGIKDFARLTYSENAFEKFIRHVDYYQMDLSNENDYLGLNDYYEKHGCRNHVFYFAVAPKFFLPISVGLKHIAYAYESKVIIEKPFGETIEKGKELNQKLEKHFHDYNIFHIDHYLGKEMVQNIQTIRFKNALFKHAWNHEMIENVQISAFEKGGIGNRGAYYDENGALKDMVQNHLFQVLSILAAEESEDQHKAQLEVLKHLKPLKENDLVLGQYEDYLQEKDVCENSKTETYAALTCMIDNERWQGVPFYIRTGKNLSKREITVVIQFKAMDGVKGNVLLIRIQPTEGVYFQFNIKKPGSKDEIETVQMDFCQSCLEINRINTPEAYERLLKAAMNDDRDYFSTWDEIETSSRFIENIQRSEPYIYKVGSVGPKEADQLLKRNGHAWYEI